MMANPNSSGPARKAAQAAQLRVETVEKHQNRSERKMTPNLTVQHAGGSTISLQGSVNVPPYARRNKKLWVFLERR